jgi:hypothetical protein
MLVKTAAMMIPFHPGVLWPGPCAVIFISLKFLLLFLNDQGMSLHIEQIYTDQFY